MMVSNEGIRTSTARPRMRCWLIRVDANVWTFYDKTFAGAMAQLTALMVELFGEGWAPMPGGSTLFKIEHHEIFRRGDRKC